jgi:ring-1,2-phenylacetyl-CoA epoxidase subunit PaaB
MNLVSLDPRLNRLEIPQDWGTPILPKDDLDQLETYEVFHEAKEGKPFTHVGNVHASTEDMAFLYAKEQYGRRYSCVGMWTVKTRNVLVSEMGNDNENILDKLSDTFQPSNEGNTETYDVFFQRKKGTHHIHVGNVDAKNHAQALLEAKKSLLDGKPITNVWIVKSSDIMKSTIDDKVIWATVLEKKYRDAMAYKVADRIEKYKEANALN